MKILNKDRQNHVCLHNFSGELRQKINENKWVSCDPYKVIYVVISLVRLGMVALSLVFQIQNVVVFRTSLKGEPEFIWGRTHCNPIPEIWELFRHWLDNIATNIPLTLIISTIIPYAYVVTVC